MAEGTPLTKADFASAPAHQRPSTPPKRSMAASSAPADRVWRTTFELLSESGLGASVSMRSPADPESREDHDLPSLAESCRARDRCVLADQREQEVPIPGHSKVTSRRSCQHRAPAHTARWSSVLPSISTLPNATGVADIHSRIQLGTPHRSEKSSSGQHAEARYRRQLTDPP